MIANFLANNPYFLTVLAIFWQTAELYLGLKKPMDAGSVPQLLFRFIQRVFSPKPKGVTDVPTNPNARMISVSVDGPTYDLGGTILDSTHKLLSGEKPQQVLAEELVPLVAQMGALAQIPADFAGDRASVLNAAALRAVQLEEAVRLHPAVVVVPALVSK